jgi:hypothetical protein
VCTGNENSKPIWNKSIIRKDIIETIQVVLNFCGFYMTFLHHIPSDYISCFFVPRNKILLLFIFFSDNYRLLYGMFGPWANIGVSGWYDMWYEKCHIITYLSYTSMRLCSYLWELIVLYYIYIISMFFHFRLVLITYWFISLRTCCWLARFLRCSLHILIHLLTHMLLFSSHLAMLAMRIIWFQSKDKNVKQL